uniref:Uncharacterized protein n=1 Tax=Ciona intestinalis TaxID=7719 RepID=H2XL94_CIOIN
MQIQGPLTDNTQRGCGTEKQLRTFTVDWLLDQLQSTRRKINELVV